MAAEKIANLLMNPLVSGMPAKASIRKVKTAAVPATGAPVRPSGTGGSPAVGVPDQGHHAERGDDREAVRDQVEHRGGDALGAEGEGADEQVPGVGDRRVREQPLDVGLGHREDARPRSS